MGLVALGVFIAPLLGDLVIFPQIPLPLIIELAS